MNKNSKIVSLKIPDKAKVVIEVYQNEKSSNDGLIFPYLLNADLNDSEQISIRTQTITRNLNRHLKKVATKLEINKNMSMYYFSPQ
jgi:hypothetical protein